MTHPWMVLALAIGMAGLRVSGLALGGVRIPAAWERAWRYVPLSLLSALVAISLTGKDAGETNIRALALIFAGLITFRYRRLWVCIVSGMTIYFGLRFAS